MNEIRPPAVDAAEVSAGGGLLGEVAILRDVEVGEVEAKFVEYLKRRLDEGHLSVSDPELREGVLRENPGFRNRAAFRHAIQRLRVRGVFNAIDAPDGTRHYFIGNYPDAELRASLGLE